MGDTLAIDKEDIGETSQGIEGLPKEGNFPEGKKARNVWEPDPVDDDPVFQGFELRPAHHTDGRYPEFSRITHIRTPYSLGILGQGFYPHLFGELLLERPVGM